MCEFAKLITVFAIYPEEIIEKDKEKQKRYKNVNGYDTDGWAILWFANSLNGNEHNQHCQSYAKANDEQCEFSRRFFYQ